MFEALIALVFGSFIFIAAAAFVLLVFVALLYNTLVSKKNRADNAFASVDVLLKKRYDLIPNLVAAVKGYMTHERDVLEKVTELRAKAISPNVSADQKVEFDNQMSSFLRGIMVSVENYPQLKASTNFLQLQSTLNEVEEQISAARRAYNAAILEYNNAVEMLPTNVMASLMKYKQRKFFEIAVGERENVAVGEMLSKK
jgi:LemA protein